MDMTRRALIAATAALACPTATRASISPVPRIDRLELTVVVDSAVALFNPSINRPDLTVIPAPRTRDYRTTFAAQWGYSLLARSRLGAERRTILVDFGDTPEALLNNMALLDIDPARIDAMVLSHGHYDHFGGLDGLLQTGKIRRGTPLFVGGEEAFCARLRGTTPDSPSFGAIDRPMLAKAGIDLRIGGAASPVAGQGFTTGRIPFVTSERPQVPSSMLPGQNCARAELDPDRRDKDFLVDDAVHELGTVFNLADRGLVVVGSCSHRGIINTVRQAQAVSGVTKVHAIVGGFHLVAPQTRQQALDTLAMMQAINPDYIIPGHCTGEVFIAAAQQAMPDKVLRSVVGTTYILGAQG